MRKSSQRGRYGSNAGTEDGTLFSNPQLDEPSESRRVPPQEFPGNPVAEKVEEDPPVELAGTTTANGDRASPVEPATVGTPDVENSSIRHGFALTNSHPRGGSIPT